MTQAGKAQAATATKPRCSQPDATPSAPDRGAPRAFRVPAPGRQVPAVPTVPRSLATNVTFAGQTHGLTTGYGSRPRLRTHRERGSANCLRPRLAPRQRRTNDAQLTLLAACMPGSWRCCRRLLPGSGPLCRQCRPRGVSAVPSPPRPRGARRDPRRMASQRPAHPLRSIHGQPLRALPGRPAGPRPGCQPRPDRVIVHHGTRQREESHAPSDTTRRDVTDPRAAGD